MECPGFQKVSQQIHNLPFKRITTVDPQKCTGITFFFNNGLLDVHAHTSAKPNPLETFNRMRPFAQNYGTWAYLPLPRGDTIRAFGKQESKYRRREYEGACRYLVSIANLTSICPPSNCGSSARLFAAISLLGHTTSERSKIRSLAPDLTSH